MKQQKANIKRLWLIASLLFLLAALCFFVAALISRQPLQAAAGASDLSAAVLFFFVAQKCGGK